MLLYLRREEKEGGGDQEKGGRRRSGLRRRYIPSHSTARNRYASCHGHRHPPRPHVRRIFPTSLCISPLIIVLLLFPFPNLDRKLWRCCPNYPVHTTYQYIYIYIKQIQEWPLMDHQFSIIYLWWDCRFPWPLLNSPFQISLYQVYIYIHRYAIELWNFVWWCLSGFRSLTLVDKIEFIPSFFFFFTFFSFFIDSSNELRKEIL